MKYKIVSLFSGAGGLDLGFEKAKFDYKSPSCEDIPLAFPVIIVGFIAVILFFKTDFIIKFITENII